MHRVSTEDHNMASEKKKEDVGKKKKEEEEEMEKRKKSFMRKFFWEGQHLEEELQVIPDDANVYDRFLIKYRKYIAFLIPLVLMHILWWSSALRYDWLSLYSTRWQLPLVMVLGALVAGMTSEGGGAVAFPVMTLALHIPPAVARDFSLIIQSIGMSCATFVILFMGVTFEKRAVLFGTIGSIPGLIFGSLFVDPVLSGPEKKMLFVSIWSSFAIALWMLNREKERDTFPVIPSFNYSKALILVVTGFVGGIFTSFAGSGVDICVFSILTLLFRVTEKTATPTTIVLMALNSLVGVYYRAVMEADVSDLAWDYIKVSVPVAVTLAPFGSFLGSHFHRKVLAWFIYILEAVAIVGFVITKPPTELLLIGAGIMFVAFFFFKFITRTGHNMMQSHKEKESKDFEMSASSV